MKARQARLKAIKKAEGSTTMLKRMLKSLHGGGGLYSEAEGFTKRLKSFKLVGREGYTRRLNAPHGGEAKVRRLKATHGG